MVCNVRVSVRSKIIINNNTEKGINTFKLSRFFYFNKVNVRPKIGRETQRWSKSITPLFLQLRRNSGWVFGQCHAPADLKPRKTFYPL
jgi:hypothetical protein